MKYRDREMTIESAFQKLEKATKEKEEELKRVIPSQFSPLMEKLASNALEGMSKALPVISHVFKDGEEVSRTVIKRIQKEIKRSPWSLLGKVALCSFGIGFLFGSCYKKQPRSMRNDEVESE